VGAHAYEELEAWQLANAARDLVFRITQRPAFDRDLWLRRQLRGAADSACSSIAEGFGRYRPREFAYFLGVAVGSLEEVKNRRSVLLSIGACSEAEAAELYDLASRGCGAAINLVRDLRSQGTDR